MTSAWPIRPRRILIARGVLKHTLQLVGSAVRNVRASPGRMFRTAEPTKDTGGTPVPALTSIVRFGLLPTRPRLPAAVDPPVLAGVGADDVFEGLRVPLGDVPQRVVLRLPVVGEDDVLGADGELELVV